MRRIGFYRLYRTLKSPIFIISAALIFAIFCIYLNQPGQSLILNDFQKTTQKEEDGGTSSKIVSSEELRKSNIGEPDSITASPAIQQRHRTKKHVIKAWSRQNISSDIITSPPIQYRNITHFHEELRNSSFGAPVLNITSPTIQERHQTAQVKFVSPCKSYERGSIITSSPIQQRSLDSPNTYDIGILVIVNEGADLKEYRVAIDTLECYSRLHNYGFEIVWVNNTWKEICRQQQFMFIRHCIASNLLYRHDWTLFLDADVAVINPSRLIDTFVAENEKVADLVFYDRFFNWEIAAGSYLAKNSSYAKEFLIKFANMDFSLPANFHGSDNGAIHWLFVQEFFVNQTSEVDPNVCHTLWKMSKSWDDVFVYEACCRLIMGETKLFHDPAGKGAIMLSPKGQGWMRDGWLTNTKWSLDTDFMLHGWKHSFEVPRFDEADPSSQQKSCEHNGTWFRAIANPSFDLAACSNGTIQWQWWSTFLTSKKEVQDFLMKKRLGTQKEFFKFQALIPKYLNYSKNV